ncbi:MAG: class I SAM-dependent methyltransferase [Solirubrobacterales bacterium]|nr:class I SAM-dependent methyltransferase [Solirubrobacterales bacterium]
MCARITGERVVTPEGGFNPTWQRHVAAYRLLEPEFGLGRLLDLGCGVGHSFHLLDPRETVGVDIEPDALQGQDRETHVADMRDLPFDPASFESVFSVHSLEHVPDPERVLAEVARVITADGTAAFVTPNRLTFGRPDEIIDPFHFIEFDARQLEELCGAEFNDVVIHGIFGSDRYMTIHDREREKLDRLLGFDPLKLRRLVPNRARRGLYDTMLNRSRSLEDPEAEAITVDDFSLGDQGLETALDVVAVCRGPRG